MTHNYQSRQILRIRCHEALDGSDPAKLRVLPTQSEEVSVYDLAIYDRASLFDHCHVSPSQ